MATQMTIGQRDLGFYAGCIESEKAAMRRCTPAEESRYAARIKAAADVVAALTAYNALTHGEATA